MEEVAVNSRGEMELEVEETEIARAAETNNNSKKIVAEGDSSIVSWERFLPKVVVRVLLVEADDSTRQIISALLRKCSYRVAAVPDGLKAWELLKVRPHNIDLILTEVELPAISGYALLTLIMEHQICKNIPVIMMSSHDSVSTVYKCMLRGAADFLVKPVRKNELRNLWQHVWRKQVSNTGAGLGPPLEGVAQEKDEATAENNDGSNNQSSGCKSSSQRNKEYIEKGSDAQSSCTKPELETEKEDTDNAQHILLPMSVHNLADDVKIPAQEDRHQESRKRHMEDDENGDLQPMQKVFSNYTAATQSAEKSRVNMDSNSNHVVENSSRGAIDLIGVLDNQHRGTFGSPQANFATKSFEGSPLLDLSLRRSNPSGSVNQQDDDMHKLNHSDASPFSRYISKPLQHHSSMSPRTCNQQKGHDAHGPSISSMASILEEQPENAFSYSQTREISHPVPIRGARLENLTNARGSAVASVCSRQQGHSSSPSPGAAQHSDSFSRLKSHPFDSQPSTSHQFHSVVDHHNINISIEQTDSKQCKKLEIPEGQGHAAAPANDQSTNTGFCNGSASNIQSAGSGSIGNFNAISITKAPLECGSEEGSSHRSIQREAALTKFRQKRKDRCFEKKVRYESRKKLAEQRPRVKGQFVRQAPNDTQPGS
ncbi:two-component response regulator-like APRR5 [Andrographis paniculata]|uniref:two-component response regulator-like APRR5 n=1 Tax=Andrographis paniculata TaxID=175694 RepID=UPI0021E7BA75|nr:two-component response regulator-like APRR5 [Andrographis paniculata]